MRVCSFEAVPGKKRQSYEEFRAAALAAGRFSSFEATANPGPFTRLCRDPSVETFNLGYPWIGVRARESDSQLVEVTR